MIGYANYLMVINYYYHYYILTCNIKYILHKYNKRKSLETLRNVHVFPESPCQFACDHARDGAFIAIL